MATRRPGATIGRTEYPTMRLRHSLFALPALFLVACTAEKPVDHPLAGNWAQDTGTDAKGINLEFDPASAKMTVHTAPRADGTHDHPAATYTFDAATKAVTVKCKLLGDAKADTWTGTLAGAVLELAGGADKLKFKKGGSAH
jgi:hypothetical protein